MPDRHRLNAFDQWLDDEVTGTPVTDRDSSDTNTAATAENLYGSAREFHGLVARAERDPANATTSDRLNQIWEDIMVTTAQPVSHSAHRQRVASQSRVSLPKGWSTHFPVGSRLTTVLNSMVAAALIVVVTAGFWRYNGAPDWFGGSGPEPLRFAAMTSQGEQDFEVPPVPTADDCTVAPLTVDEVLGMVKPYSSDGPSMASQATPATSPASTPYVSPPWMGNLSTPVPDELVRAVVAAQRMWVACNMTGEPFKVWATETQGLVREKILAPYVSGFNPDTLREELEALATNGPDGTRFALPVYAEGTFVPVAVPDAGVQFGPLSTEEEATSRITISIAWQSLDGSVVGVPGYLTQQQLQDPAFETLEYRLDNTAVFLTSDGTTYQLESLSRVQG